MGTPDCLAALTVSLCSLIKSQSCTLPHQCCLWHTLHCAGGQPDAHVRLFCRWRSALWRDGFQGRPQYENLSMLILSE